MNILMCYMSALIPGFLSPLLPSMTREVKKRELGIMVSYTQLFNVFFFWPNKLYS